MLKQIVIGALSAAAVLVAAGVFSYCFISPFVLTKDFQEFQTHLVRLEGQVTTLTQMRTQVVNLTQGLSEVRQEVAGLRPPAAARFLDPPPLSRVGVHFRVAVEVTNPRSDRFYWLANEVESNFWPKACLTVPPQGGNVAARLNEGGDPPQGRFSVRLFEVGPEEDARLRAWLHPADGRFPGLQIDGLDLAGLPLVLDRGR